MGDAANDDYLRYEAQLAHYESLIDSKTWVTKDGQRLHISDMETSHIKNCINLLKNHKNYVTNQYIDIFQQEIKYRENSNEKSRTN